MAVFTVIKRIHNLIPPSVGMGVVATVQNLERNFSFTPDISFLDREDRDVDWPIPWAWEESHFTMDHRHIDIRILSTPGALFCIWQQDGDIWASPSDSFTDPNRVNLGPVGGERRLLIRSSGVELIGMLDPLPPDSGLHCIPKGGPYVPLPSDEEDASATPSGMFMLKNVMWFARFHSVEVGFQARVFAPSAGKAIEVEASWDANPKMHAEGLGYASARLLMRLEAHPEDMTSGALGAPFVRTQEFWGRKIVLGFAEPQGQFFGFNPVASLNFTPQTATDHYVLRAFLRSEVGGFGLIKAEASCHGKFLGFNVCRCL